MKFKVGDHVEIIEKCHGYKVGDKLTVSEVIGSKQYGRGYLFNNEKHRGVWYDPCVKLCKYMESPLWKKLEGNND